MGSNGMLFLFVALLSALLFFFIFLHHHGVHCTEPLVARQNYYGGHYQSPSPPLSLALPITSQQQLTLQQLYGAARAPDVRFALNFAREPNRWDPYNPASEFRWRDRNPGAGIPADNAYIELTNSGPYAKPYAPKKAALLSAPFQTWFPLNDSMDIGNIVNPTNEGGLQWKSNVTIDSSQRFLVRFKCSCKILRAENHPFPASLVSHPDDDPRLANCNLQIQPRDNNATSIIRIAITNKSVWAVYLGAFGIAKRRIGIRRTYNDLVDVGLEYNAMTSQYVFYVSGHPVWQVADSLQPPPVDGITKVDPGDPIPTNVALPPRPMPIFSFAFGTHKCLDESDPWNQTDHTLLVRIFGYDGYYPISSVFYDNDDLRSNNLWGQTVKMTLYKVLVATVSAALPPTATTNINVQIPYYNTAGDGSSGLERWRLCQSTVVALRILRRQE